ncbi:HAMP domain-containing histidine kinase [Clostridioides mangenotii]|uniref:sensor histidine kinase n=1 Tax=Metaclostridioides mangenotii TaxID=1540 RepID=UPI001C0F43FE|nr:HAMP domain-containing sensor histidine kinase [Clostridioides mangenotii]MBU5307465.1 HAMP domain-containing histidine kinase [Clostridioides mangenotii]
MDYRSKKTSLNKRLIITLVSVILLVVVAIGVSINKVFQKKFGDYITKNYDKEVSVMLNSIESGYKDNKWDVMSIKKMGDIAISKGIFVEVYDQDKNLVWGAMQSNRSRCHEVMGSIRNNMNNMHNNWDGDYTVELHELYDGSQKPIGIASVGSYGSLYYMDNDVNFLNEINKIIAILGIVMTIITIMIAILIANKISRPIEIVSNMANEMGKGGYKQKLEYESNISEIDKLISSINELAYKLDEQENLRKRLTTDVAHELRTPLTNIQTHIEAMIDGIWEPSNERLNSVNEEVIRLTHLVNELKNLAKFDSEKSKLELSEVDVAGIIKNTIYNNQASALEKNINITSDIEDITTYLDKEKITQVVLNLLSNAIRYTNEYGNINIRAYRDNNDIKIHIKDDGIGIPNDKMNYIFERFYRIDESRSKDTGGIGVGLTIVKSIVDLHGGSIYVNSVEGKGSEFVVVIPEIDKL